jgi:2-dehydro-3-deoxygalactonokinase
VSNAPFIAGDWGTTRLRLMLCADGSVLDVRTGPGIGALSQSPAQVIRALIPTWIEAHGPLPLVLCGMVGSRNGWVETPYVPCPSDVASWCAGQAHFESDGLMIRIAAGLSCMNRLSAPDVMRGEETQIFGALAMQPELARGRRLFCLPGTHTKWVWVEDGKIGEFLTALTGELFALLRDHSMLARAGAAGGTPGDGFVEGLARHASLGAADLTHALFEARSRQLILGASKEWALAWLSGVLIASDVHGALGLFGGSAQVVLIGDPALTELYAQALMRPDTEVLCLDGGDCALAGLRSLLDHSSRAQAHAAT